MNQDKYWLDICNSIASNSKCLSRKLGAVIVKNDRFIVSTGYNGPPSKCLHCDNEAYRKYLFDLMLKDKLFDYLPSDIDNKRCPRQAAGFIPRASSGIEYCQASHAERNAIAIAAKLGHSTDGCSMYMNGPTPCFECAKSVINAGIKEIIVTKLEDYEKIGITGRRLLEQAGVKIRKYNL